MSSGILPNDRADPYSRPHGSATLLPTPTPPAPDSCLLEKTPTDFSQTPNSQLASPQSTTPSSGKATHICDQCARAFSRAEHLERHQTTHLPSNATKSFVCTSCGKGFTRKDVLTRHIRAVHETKKPDVRKSRRKSCRRCAAFKIKCTGGGKGKQSGDRAAEACEACRKREVECIFDFGVTVGGGDMQDDEQAGDIFDYGSEDARSDPETACSEYSTKRRKTIHTSSGTPTYLSASTSGTTSAVSSHLLSAARLASSQTNQSERQLSDSVMQLPDQALELSSADHLLSMATFANKGLQIPETDRRSFSHRPMPREPPGPSAGYGHDPMSHLYFPPMRDSGSNRKPENEGAMVNRIAEEDLNAANTLQGINPAPSTMMSLNYRSGLDGPWKNNMVDDTNAQAGGTVRPLDMSGIMSRNFSTDYSNTGNAYFRSPMFGSSSLPPLSGAVEANSGQNGESSGLGVPGDGLSLEAGLDLPDDDSFFFDFNIFDNSTDWLRDWGPNESISPESHAGMDGLDILETLPDATFGIGLTPNYGGDYMGGSLQPFTPGPPATPGPAPEEPVESTPKPHHLSIGEDGRVPPPGIQVPGLPTASPSKDHSGNAFLPWGWQHGSGLKEDPGRKVTLPPLRHVLPERSNENESQQYGQIPAGTQVFDEDGVITEGMRKEMIHVLTLPSARPPYPRFETSEIERAFPTKEVIATFIKLYFDQFHPILPVIHRPTFCIEKCPSILLLAMISIGASYSNLKHSKAFADSLSELCKRYLAWMAENNPAYGRSPFYLQSMCLQNLYAMGSGSTSLYDAADVSRSVIIGNARRIGLFSGSISPTTSSPSSAPESPLIRPSGETHLLSKHDDIELETRWREWRDKEGLKRLAWGIFEYDSSFSTLSNRRGAVTISDITIKIPCSESLWGAPTAAHWAAQLEQEPEPRSLPFYQTLKCIISGRFDAKSLSSWGKRLCAQAMGRIMWDFKELEESVLSVGSVGNTFKPQKEMLLRCLMRLCESATPRAGEAEGDRYHWILARLIAHYTHLHAAFPTISLMLTLARKPPPLGEEINDPRIKRLHSIFNTDPVGARTLAWHATQIIALSRWRPVFSPVEGMRLFLAGVVLWGFGNYHRVVTHDASTALYHRQDDYVRLDLLPWASGGSGAARGTAGPEDWMRYGKGTATIEICGEVEGVRVVEVCGEEGAKEVLRVVVGILSGLKVWGLGGEFKEVLEGLMAR